MTLLLLLLSAFPFSQGWPQRIIILHIFLSSTSVSFVPTSSISSFTTSKNLLFGLPLLLFPGNSISISFLPTYSWSLLMTCPYHLSLPSLIFIPNRSTLTVLLMCSFLILSNTVETGYYDTGYNDNSLLTTYFCWSRQNSYLLCTFSSALATPAFTTIRF